MKSLGQKAIMQRGPIEHEQIIYESSNRRVKHVRLAQDALQ